MGVKGIHRHVFENIPSSSVDLVALARESEHPVVILVDYFAFAFYVAENMVSRLSDEDGLLDSSALGRFEFAENSKLRAIVLLFVGVLRNANIQLEFIGDGAYKFGSEEGDTKADEWAKRVKRRVDAMTETEEAFTSGYPELAYNIRTDMPLPDQFTSTLADAVRESKSPLWFCEGEADKLIAEISRRRCASNPNDPLSSLPPVYAILSNDSDFALMNGCQLMTAHMIDNQGHLKKCMKTLLGSVVNWMDPICPISVDPNNSEHRLSHLFVNVFSPSVVGRFLGLAKEELVEMTILAGNDFTKELFETLRIRGVPPTGQIVKIVSCLKQNKKGLAVRVEDCSGVAEALRTSDRFRKAVKFSRIFYGYQSETALNPDIEKFEFDEYCKWRLNFGHSSRTRFCVNDDDSTNIRRCSLTTVCPKFALQFYERRTMFMHPNLQFMKADICIEDTRYEFTRYLAGILNIKKPIRMMGRKGAKFPNEEFVDPLPSFPPNLTFTAVAVAAQTDPLAAKKATAEFFNLYMGVDIFTVENVNPRFVWYQLLSRIKIRGINFFLRHEVESLIVTGLIIGHFIQDMSKLTHPDDIALVNDARLPADEFQEIIAKLEHCKSDDPLGVVDGVQRRVYQRSPNLNGFVCGYRYLAMSGWSQHLLSNIYDVFQFYTMGCAEAHRPTRAVFQNGDIDRWVYAAGAMQWDSEKRPGASTVIEAAKCLPKAFRGCSMNTLVPQFEFVAVLRNLILKTPQVTELLQSLDQMA